MTGQPVAVPRPQQRPADRELPGHHQLARLRAGRDLYAGGRATFGISDRANVFVKAGYTNARFKYDGTLGNFAENAEGYRLGAGAQFALAGARYRLYPAEAARSRVLAEAARTSFLRFGAQFQGEVAQIDAWLARLPAPAGG